MNVEVDKTVFLDEGSRAFSNPSDELKEYMKKIRLLSNQHLLNEDKTDLKPSATIEQQLLIKTE